MIILSRSDVQALHDCMGRSEPVTSDELTRMTGLDVRKLKESGIVRHIGQWPDAIYRGPAWPTLETNER